MAVFSVRSPLTQTILARMATSFLSSQLKTEIKIERLHITGFSSLSLSNLLVKDLNHDTLVYTRDFKIDYGTRLWKVDIFQLNSVELNEADVRISKSPEVNESNLQFLLDYFTGNTREAPADTLDMDSSEEGEGEPFLLSLGKISVYNSSFQFFNPNREKKEIGVDFSDIHILGLTLDADQLSFEQDTFRVHVNHVTLYEQSGFMVDSLACDFTLAPTLLQAHNLLARTPLNNLDLDFSFQYNSMKDFKDFINKVNIQTSIRPSLINLTEVGYFAPVMFNMYDRLRVSAEIRGTVSNFKASELKVGIGKTTQFRGKVQMNGLPDIRETFTHLTVTDFISTVEDARAFRLPTDEIYIDLPEMLAKFGVVRIKGKFTGFYNDFVSYADFKTSIGDFNTDILLRVNKNNNIEYNGHLAATDFHAGKFLDIEENVGQLDLSLNLAGSGIDFENLQVSMDGRIDSLEFFKNLYNEIDISGGISSKRFSGDLSVRDENVLFDFDGSIDYGKNIPSYNFTARLKDAYLSRINLIDRDTSARLSTNMNINFMGDNIDNIQGIIIIDSTQYEEGDQFYEMEDFTLSVTRDSTRYAFLRLYSDFIDASLEGSYSLDEMPLSIINLFNQYVDTLVPDTAIAEYEFLDQDFIFTVNVKDPTPFTELFVPQLAFEEGIRFSGGFNERIGNLFFDGESPLFTYNSVDFENWHADFFIDGDYMTLKTGAEEVRYSDTLKSDKLRLQFKAKNDSIKYYASWDDDSKVMFSKADIAGTFFFADNENYSFQFDRADLNFTGTPWKIYPNNLVRISSDTIRFENMGITSNQQDIGVHGLISPDPTDTLLVVFNDFNLSSFDRLLKSLKIDMDGLLNGTIKVIDYYNSPFLLSNVHVDQFKFNKEELGEASVTTVWDRYEKAFDMKASIIYHGNIGQDSTFLLRGRYYPERRQDNFDFAAELNKFKLTTLEPFTRSFSSDIEGMAVGKVFLKGSKGKPELTGEINLIRTSMLIDYLNVKYYFADRITLDKRGIYFKNIAVRDSLHNTALATGSVTHNYLTDFVLDLNISTSMLAGMNTRRSHNEAFYGRVLTSGNVSISGPFDNIVMDITARSERGTSIKIPISYGTDVGSNDYIVFVGAEEEPGQPIKRYDVDMGGVSLNLGLNITNDADIQMFMPYNMGNMRAKGNGDMKMNIDPAGNLNMEGQYVIDRGSFFFTLQNIINRTFDIERGSRVTWTGDPYNAQINMKALYRVKTTLGEYGPPEDSATRVPVNCIITLSNNLINPEIHFSVEFPDLNDDVQRYIYARLDTSDQAEMSRQMISLMVMNSFYQPSGFSGSVGFNTFDLVTNQLNNWLSSISNDFDIGVNYRPGDEISSREVEVALSTQLFDDRVLVDGNVGMRGDEATSQNTNNIVGEVTVEVKITKDGRFRAKAFNRSNNNYLVRNFAPYTQGVGVFYTQEFNKLNEIFSRRKDKKQNKTEPANDPEESEETPDEANDAQEENGLDDGNQIPFIFAPK